MAIVFGLDIPVLEFLLILNIIMLFYIIISMFEIRSLVKLRKELEILVKKPTEPNRSNEITVNEKQKQS
ncbi:hypothetical protein A3K64_03455 [Candidatus Micrarchaeota archaeon RBG_16_36_9]|nr:MAG: hypothetical protein A3K64_03455 [Candidatus Micrarchaeota archaeon RBG_16_36_9]